MKAVTPGPWTAEWDETSDNRGIAICSADGVLACILPPDDEALQSEDWANARLIAAAPDLLAALKEIFNLCGGEDSDSLLQDIAATAIDKAEGQS